MITRFLLKQAGVKADEADSGAATLIQRFGSSANLNIHLHCLVLDVVYRRGADGVPRQMTNASRTSFAIMLGGLGRPLTGNDFPTSKGASGSDSAGRPRKLIAGKLTPKLSQRICTMVSRPTLV